MKWPQRKHFQHLHWTLYKICVWWSSLTAMICEDFLCWLCGYLIGKLLQNFICCHVSWVTTFFWHFKLNQHDQIGCNGWDDLLIEMKSWNAVVDDIVITYARDDWQVDIEKASGFHFNTSQDHNWDQLVNLYLELFVWCKFSFWFLDAYNQSRPHVFDTMTTNENNPQLENVRQN